MEIQAAMFVFSIAASLRILNKVIQILTRVPKRFRGVEVLVLHQRPSFQMDTSSRSAPDVSVRGGFTSVQNIMKCDGDTRKEFHVDVVPSCSTASVQNATKRDDIDTRKDVYAHFVLSTGTTVLLLAYDAFVARKCSLSQAFSQRHLLASNAPVTRKCCS